MCFPSSILSECLTSISNLNIAIWGRGLYGCTEGSQKNDETNWPGGWSVAMVAKGWWDATLIKGEFLECAFLNYGSCFEICIWSNAIFIFNLYMPQSKPVCDDLRQGLKTLKDSQVYPSQYGKEIARLHLAHVAACRHLYFACHYDGFIIKCNYSTVLLLSF